MKKVQVKKTRVAKAATLRQKLVVANLLKARQEGRKVTIGKAMEEAGYSPSYSKSGQLTSSDVWGRLMEEFLPDTLLAQEHQKLLKLSKVEHMVFPTSMTNKEITGIVEGLGCTVKKFMFGANGTHVWFYAPDGIAKKNALDMAYKLKARYDYTVTLKGKLGSLSDEEIENRIAAEVSAVIGALAGEGAPENLESGS